MIIYAYDRIFRDEAIWEHRDKSNDAYYRGRNYYGVSFVNKKLPNSYVLSGVIVFMLFGMLGQYLVAR